MRAVAVSLIMLVPLLAGCLGGDRADPAGDGSLPLDVDKIRVGEGGKLIETTTGAVVELLNVSFPFRDTIVVPGNATIIRVQAELTENPGASVRTYMTNAETDRRRCNPDVVDTAWNVGHSGFHQCSGLAAIDPPGTEWEIQVSGPVNAETGTSVPNLVRVVYENAPLDGPVAELDLSQLSMPEHNTTPTDAFYVDGFDGTPLWVEVTLPDGDGPWPTVIAASPYNGQSGRLDQPGGTPAMWGYWTHDWVKRGYAAVNVDVRGFGLSGGCVEVWGENEQRDQAFIVDWVADQDWSDGNVGFYGQSYVGTTPVAAAVQTPEALKAIIAVAPVINAYEDWHYGGVPNGENTGSPVAYQVYTDPVPQPNPNNPDPAPFMDPLTLVQNKAKGLCDPTLIVRANDARAIYDDYYIERDFKLRADQVDAAVLFTQGFEDQNVKSAMIPGWFNEIQAPKLGIFGHWVHQHPPRADSEVLFLGWMDQYVKGKDLGFDSFPKVLVQAGNEHERTTDSWPTTGLNQTLLWPDWGSGGLSTDEGSAGGAALAIGPASEMDIGAASITVSYEIEEPFAFSGTPYLHMRGTLETGGNAFLGATIWDAHEDGRDLITRGMFNLAHDETHTSWNPVTGPSDVMMPFLPTEYVLKPGHRLEIDLYGVTSSTFPGLGAPAGRFLIGEHPDGVGPLMLDTVPMDEYHTVARTGEI